MKPTALIIIILTALASCKNIPLPTQNQQSSRANHSLRDSIIQRHFNRLAASDAPDTADLDNRLLRAYVSNDTSLLKKLDTLSEWENRWAGFWTLMKKGTQQPKFPAPDADEAYRFDYLRAFCPDAVCITVSRSGNNATLDVLLYQHQQPTDPCKIIEQYKKPLTIDNWKKIVESLTNADFWGLRRSNGDNYLDSDMIEITGYERSAARTRRHQVDRENLARSKLYTPFHTVLDLSGLKPKCF